ADGDDVAGVDRRAVLEPQPPLAVGDDLLLRKRPDRGLGAEVVDGPYAAVPEEVRPHGRAAAPPELAGVDVRHRPRRVLVDPAPVGPDHHLAEAPGLVRPGL